MDPRVLLVVGLALCLLCVVPLTGATYTFSAVVSVDSMIDEGVSRKVILQIDTSLVSTNTDPTISSLTAQIAPSSYASTSTQNASYASINCPSGANPCLQSFLITFSPVNCLFSGTIEFTYVPCDSLDSCTTTPNFSVNLAQRDLCLAEFYTLSANITSYGAFADHLFSQTKSTYYINDMVYFPFQVMYTDFTVSSLTFDTITVDSGTGPVTIFYSTNTGAGNVIGLNTHPMTSSLSNGGAIVWFGLQLNREAGSPFADTPTSLTTYTFSVAFDVEYKNAKRALPVEQKQLRSGASIVVSSQKASNDQNVVVGPTLTQQPRSLPLTNSGNYLTVGAMSLLSGFAALYLF